MSSIYRPPCNVCPAVQKSERVTVILVEAPAQLRAASCRWASSWSTSYQVR